MVQVSVRSEELMNSRVPAPVTEYIVLRRGTSVGGRGELQGAEADVVLPN